MFESAMPDLYKQELSSVYQFIAVLYNLQCILLSSSDDELDELFDLVSKLRF